MIRAFLCAMCAAVLAVPFSAIAQGTQYTTYDSKEYPLHAAAEEGHVPKVRRLLDKGASPNWALPNSTTPLMIAAQYGHPEVAKALLAAGADANALADGDWTALIYAANYGHFEAVKVLLAADADPYMENENGWTALDMAKGKKHFKVSRLLEAAEAGIRPGNSDLTDSSEKHGDDFPPRGKVGNCADLLVKSPATLRGMILKVLEQNGIGCYRKSAN